MSHRQAAVSLLLSLATMSIVLARPQVIFWWDSHPGFPPRSEWPAGVTAAEMAKRTYYTQREAAPASPEAYRRLKALGFDAVGLPGFEGPIRYFDGDSDAPVNLDNVAQRRNREHCIGWARDAGLQVYHNIHFFRGEPACLFSWRDECWTKVLHYVRQMARYARRTGSAGLIFDFEPYDIYLGDPYFFWNVDYWVKTLGVTRQQFLQLLRQRAAELAQAIAAEFPDCDLRVYGIGTAAGSVQDYQDVIAWFVAGLAEAKLPRGIQLDMPNTYYNFDPKWVGDIYDMDCLPHLERTAKVSREPGYVRDQCAISLGTAPIHRWHTGDGMYDRAVADLTPERFEAQLIALLAKCPRSVWVVGEATFDWTMPEISAQVTDDPTGFWGLGIPFRDMSQRNQALTAVFQRVMKLSDQELASRFQQLAAEADAGRTRLREQLGHPTVAHLSYQEAILDFTNDRDWGMRWVWVLTGYDKLDLERLTVDLPKTDVVVTCASPRWGNRDDEAAIAQPRPLPKPQEWKAYLERGGILVVGDVETNPNAAQWLAAIDPRLAVPETAACRANRPATLAEAPIMQTPNRLTLWASGRHLAGSDFAGWDILARCEHGQPIYLHRRYGKGQVAVLMSTKWQVGFGWHYVVNLLTARTNH